MEKNESANIRKYIESFVLAALLECASREDYSKLISTDIIGCIIEKIYDDLIVFAKKDPASRLDPILILKTYTSFMAVMHYRISHYIHRMSCIGEYIYLDNSLAPLLFRRGKLMSGAEIHYRCEIGDRFILDHGFGTVIGETSVIGDDCYILGGVTLGARGICGNPDFSRHPIIGDRVQIGAFTSVLGRVRVGNDVFIGPNCIITQDIPDGVRVKIRSSIQINYPER